MSQETLATACSQFIQIPQLQVDLISRLQLQHMELLDARYLEWVSVPLTDRGVQGRA